MLTSLINSDAKDAIAKVEAAQNYNPENSLLVKLIDSLTETKADVTLNDNPGDNLLAKMINSAVKANSVAAHDYNPENSLLVKLINSEAEANVDVALNGNPDDGLPAKPNSDVKADVGLTNVSGDITCLCSDYESVCRVKGHRGTNICYVFCE